MIEKAIDSKTSKQAVIRDVDNFTCACCNSALQFQVRIVIYGVSEPVEDLEISPRRISVKKASLSKRDVEVIEKYKQSGVFDSFLAAALLAGNPPKDMERAFIRLPEVLAKSSVPKTEIRKCLPPEENLEGVGLWRCNYCDVIVRAGEVLLFLPPGTVQKGVMRDAFKMNPDMTTTRIPIEAWIKTRFGYVAGKGLFLEELRQVSYGAFDSVGL